MNQKDYNEIAWIIKESINYNPTRTGENVEIEFYISPKYLINKLADYFEKETIDLFKKNLGYDNTNLSSVQEIVEFIRNKSIEKHISKKMVKAAFKKH